MPERRSRCQVPMPAALSAKCRRCHACMTRAASSGRLGSRRVIGGMGAHPARQLLLLQAPCPARRLAGGVACGFVAPPDAPPGPNVLIQIARAVKLGIFNTEVQSLKVGEIYRVASGIGTVLVNEGWAREIDGDTTNRESTLDSADDDPFHHRAAS